MRDSLLISLSTLSSSSNASIYLSLLNSTQAMSLYPLFIEAKFIKVLDFKFKITLIKFF